MTLDEVVFRAVCSLEAYLNKNGIDLVSSSSPFDPPDYSEIKAKMKEWISEAVRAANVWIPVSERLPEYDQRALVWSDYYYIAAYWPDGPAGDEKPWFNPAIGFFAAEAWMPLPEPYKEADA